MGQKGSPRGFRLILKKDWDSIWYANKKEFGNLLAEDRKIRFYLKKRFKDEKFIIKRKSGNVEVTIHTSRPGLIIGKKGTEIENLKKDLKNFLSTNVWVEVEEIKRPELEARLVANAIAKQLERRTPFRRVLKKSIQTTMDSGALGIKVQVSGRLQGAEIARIEWYKEGRIPLHELRANIDYSVARANTTYGVIGIKVWINKK